MYQSGKPWIVLAALVANACWLTTAEAQLLLQESFETDGDGSRYFVTGKGFAISDLGPAMWTESFNAPQIGPASAAPKRRAAILWDDGAFPDDFTDEAIATFGSLADWAMNGKQNATVGFFPGFGLDGTLDVKDALDAAGHTTIEIFDVASLPDPANLDLLIHTDAGEPGPATAFAAYDVPVIAYNAGNHDDTAIARIGTSLNFLEPVSINVDPANTGHPALGGMTGTIPWTTFGIPLEGIGTPLLPDHTQLATVVHPDTGETVPAIVVLEEGAALLGGFNPAPADGANYFVGADLDFAFGGDPRPPRQLDIPVNLAGQANVNLTVALAATDADFEMGDFGTVFNEPEDYLAILFDADGSGNFEILAEFTGNNAKAFEEVGSRQADGTPNFTGRVLSPTEFQDFTYSLAGGTADAVIRFEALDSFVNEIVGIDNIRVCTGAAGEACVVTPPLPDYNGDGVVNAADYTVWRNGGSPDSTQAGYDLWKMHFNEVAGSGSAVPEPTAIALLLWGSLVALAGRRK